MLVFLRFFVFFKIKLLDLIVPEEEEVVMMAALLGVDPKYLSLSKNLK